MRSALTNKQLSTSKVLIYNLFTYITLHCNSELLQVRLGLYTLGITLKP